MILAKPSEARFFRKYAALAVPIIALVIALARLATRAMTFGARHLSFPAACLGIVGTGIVIVAYKELSRRRSLENVRMLLSYLRVAEQDVAIETRPGSAEENEDFIAHLDSRGCLLFANQAFADFVSQPV